MLYAILDDKFTYIVLPRRHVRFRHLILDAKATSPQLERAISLLLLPTFLPIARITIHAAAARKLFGESSRALPVSNTLWTHHRAGSLDAFSLAARTLPDLTLVDVHYNAAVPLLCCFFSLRRLTIKGLSHLEERGRIRTGSFSPLSKSWRRSSILPWTTATQTRLKPFTPFPSRGARTICPAARH